MKNVRIALHWQIFIALLVAVLYGILFPSSFKVTNKTIKKLVIEYKDSTLVDQLTYIKDSNFNNITAFEGSLKVLMSEKAYINHKRLIIQNSYYNPAIKAVHWMGIVFLRLLKMIVIPLILLSIISGILSIGSGKNLGRLGLKTVVYYISTTIFALLTGLFFANIFKPGMHYQYDNDGFEPDLSVQHKTLGDIFIEIVPDNIFKSLLNSELLSIIFISILTGIFVFQLGTKNRQLLTELFHSLFELCMKITMFIIKLAPYGVFALVAKTIADQDNLTSLFSNLGTFLISVLAALLIHAFIILPSLMFFFWRLNPIKHFSNMLPAILTAFSTASSAATLPLTMDNVKRKSGVSEKLANFTLPIGATVNMDGTAIYIAAVVLFIAQVLEVHMGFKEQLIVLTASMLASIGTAAIPMGSLVIITIVLDIFGLPFEMIALILPVDRILDMFRTSVNIWSDSCGAAVIAKTEGEKLNI
ncbi:MAG: dicarboxylate/amino acid:cation symporter [Bacteroidales bacterium]|nr:dicarboxylate/amino acid:cation symporter [Bacteroidales bacterium]